MIEAYKLEFYVPESHLEKVKMAVFKTGAGKVGNYDCCCWETSGKGQFRPCEGSQPFVGTKDKIEKVEEIKVELIVPEQNIDEAISALMESHPYETPAYQYWKVNAADASEYENEEEEDDEEELEEDVVEEETKDGEDKAPDA